MKTFGYRSARKDKAGNFLGFVARPVVRETREKLGGRFGCDKDRVLVVSLEDGDLICFRPKGTRRRITFRAQSLYGHLLPLWAEASKKTVVKRKR